MPLTRQELVRGFQGENRLLPDALLSDRFSPDAQNVDYSRGTIKKRKGYTKLHQSAILSGGIRIENNNNNRCIIIPASAPLDLEEPSTIEFFVRFNEDHFATTAAPEILVKLDTSNTAGWRILYNSANDPPRWQITIYDGAGPPANLRAGILEQTIEVGEIYHFVITRDGTTTTFFSTPLSTNVTVSNTLFVNGTTAASDDDLWIGANGDPSSSPTTPTSQTVDITVDELRVWDDVRTTDEMDDTRFRELNEEEALDANLVGYWKFNESVGSIVNDESINQNHGTLFTGAASPNILPGLVPDSGLDGFAARFNGRDEGASIAYRADLAPALETANFWTIEAWLRLDSDKGIDDSRFLALGDFDVDNGCPFTIYVDSSLRLKISYSTEIDINNAVLDTGYDVVVGQAFHFAAVKQGNINIIRVFINGVQVPPAIDANLGQDGPTTSTLVGLTVGYMVSSAANGNFCPCTVDEIRLWNVARSTIVIQGNRDYSGPFPPIADAVLKSRLQFDADNIFVDAADPDSDITYIPDDDKPVWTQGFVYPLKPEALQLTAPLTKFLGGSDASTGQTVARHEVLVATRTDFWLLRGTKTVHLDELLDPNSADNRYTHTMYRNLLIVVNGLGRNYRYDSKEVPHSITLPTWTDTVVGVEDGVGGPPPGGYGTYTYRFAWHDHGSDLAGMSGGELEVVVAASKIHIDLSSIATEIADEPEVSHVHIYRKDPGAIVFRLITDLPLGTSTYEDLLPDPSALELMNLRRGHPNPHKICAVYANRLFLANESDNPSSIRYSDANTEDFVATNSFTVDENDGDEITGMKAAFGGLVIFKQNSIHFLTGSGATSFVLRKLIDGIGCVSHNTIAGSPGGLYFLGEDGVYIFNGQAAVYLSHSQQPEFQKLDRPKARNAVGVYDISTHEYLVSFDQAQNSETLSFFDVEPELFTHYWKLADLTDAKGVASNFTESGGAGTTAFVPDSVRGIVYDTRSGTISILDDSLSAQGSTADVTVGVWANYRTQVVSSTGPVAIRDSGGNDSVLDLNVTGAVGPLGGFTGIAVTGASLSRHSVGFNEWHHYVFTKNGNVVRFYLDGEIVEQDLATDSTWDQTIRSIIVGAIPNQAWVGRVQNLFIINDTGLTASKVKELYEAEATGKLVSTRPTFAYDEETQSWALWDKGFDTLVLAEHTSSQNDVVAGRHGFINKILHSSRDGAGFIDGDYTGVSGSLSSETGPFITDTDNNFPIVGNGLAGVEFVAVPSDTTLTTQKRLILYNTATELQLDTPLTPAVTGTYFIGPIDLHWESRWMDMGDPSVVKDFRKMLIHFKENTATLTLKYKTDKQETFKTIRFSTADELLKKVVNTRGRMLKFRFEHVATDETIEIHAFQELFDLKDEL